MASYQKYQEEAEKEKRDYEEAIKIIPLFLYIRPPKKNKGWVRKNASSYSSLPLIPRDIKKNEYILPFLINPTAKLYYESPKFNSIEAGGNSRIITEFHNVFSLPQEVKRIVVNTIQKSESTFKNEGKKTLLKPVEFFYSEGKDFTTNFPAETAFQFGKLMGVLELEGEI